MSSTTTVSRDATFETFDPNKQLANNPIWGVFEGRKFRTYNQRGHALNAYHTASRAKLYCQGPSGWEEIAVKDCMAKHEICDVCGQSTLDHPRFYNYRTRQYTYRTDLPKRQQGDFVFRRQGGRIADPIEQLFVCQVCKPVVCN